MTNEEKNNTLLTHNQRVIIELDNASNFDFIAFWNKGLGTFIGDYEKFLQGKNQSKTRYAMFNKDESIQFHTIFDFNKIVGIQLTKIP